MNVAVIAAVATIIAAVITGTATFLASRKRVKRAARGPSEAMIPSRISLVDRTNEVAEVLRRLRRGEYVVAIEGSVGVGKSALAAEISHRLLRTGIARPTSIRRFGRTYRWIAWIDARNSAPTLSQIASQLVLLTGDQRLSTAPDDDKATALRVFLAAQPCILVIDNVRLSPSSAQDFVNFLRVLPTGSVAIVSTNTPGRLTMSRVLIEDLQLDHARELLLREAKRLEVKSIYTADSDVLDEACRLIGGNPRGVELLVLACLRRPVSLADTLAELRLGSGDLSDDLFSSIWRELADLERQILVTCAYLHGRATAEQISASTVIDGEVLNASIARLWTDGFVKSVDAFGATYFSCTPVLGAFALRNTAPLATGEIRTRLAEYLTALFRSDWENASAATSHIDAIRILIKDLYDNGYNEKAYDLFEVTLDIFFTLGLFDDRISLGWLAYHAAERLKDGVRQSLALSVVSSTHSLRGEHSHAQNALDLGAQIAAAAQSEREIARQSRCAGYDLYRSGRPQEALVAVAGAELLAERAGDLHNVVDILALRSAAQWHLGDYAQCATTVDSFLRYCDAIPWQRGRAYPIRERGELALMRQSYRDAALLFDESRSIAKEYRDIRQVLRIDLSRARLLLFTGHFVNSYKMAVMVARQSEKLGLAGECQESNAVASRARTGLLCPWRWLRNSRNPQARFTENPIGGD